MRASDYGKNLPLRPDERSMEMDDIRKSVLLDTLGAFEKASATRSFHKLSMTNLQRWKEEAKPPPKPKGEVGSDSRDGSTHAGNVCKVEVVPGDWGAVTSDYTQEYGEMFAVLNMANAYSPGGGYTDGCAAQEENMFRRTDCHFSIDRRDKNMVEIKKQWWYDDYDAMYTPAMSSILNGKEGRVYLDTKSPRVCIRGPEARQQEDLGYEFLPEDQVFPFLELRAAAVDRRGIRATEKLNADMRADMRRRIVAQLETLMDAGIRHVILSAFGCGAFRNPADEVAVIYREEIEKRMSNFDVVVFAIFYAGYGPNNFTPFQRVFEGFNKVCMDPGGDNSESTRYQTPPRKRG